MMERYSGMSLCMFMDILIEMRNEDSIFGSRDLTMEEIESIMYTWKHGMRGD